jgi:hypothetical protein
VHHLWQLEDRVRNPDEAAGSGLQDPGERRSQRDRHQPLDQKHGRISRERGEAIDRRIAAARALRRRLDECDDAAVDPTIARTLEGDVEAFSVSTVCDKRELFWQRHAINFRPLPILGIAAGFGRSVVRRRPGR